MFLKRTFVIQMKNIYFAELHRKYNKINCYTVSLYKRFMYFLSELRLRNAGRHSVN